VCKNKARRFCFVFLRICTRKKYHWLIEKSYQMVQKSHRTHCIYIIAFL